MMMNKFFIIALTAMFTSVVAHGQQQIQVQAGKGIDVKKIEFQAQPTPLIQQSGAKDKKWKPRDWMEIEVEFEAKNVKPNDAVISELLFRYYVGIKKESGGGVVLTGDITHTNVVAREETFSAVYVSPATLGKITGDFRKFNPSSVIAVGVEVYYNGVLVGGKIEGSGKKFWEGQSSVAGILSRSDTPFGILWIDRYADEKPKG